MTDTFTYGEAEPCHACQGRGVIYFDAWDPAYSWDRECVECEAEGFLPHGDATAYGVGTDYGNGSDADARRFLPESEVSDDTRPEDLDETFVPEWEREGTTLSVFLTAYVPEPILRSEVGRAWVLNSADEASLCRGHRDHDLDGWADEYGDVLVSVSFDRH